MTENGQKSILKKTKKFPGKIQNRHLDRSILLKETGSNPAVKKTIILISAAVIGFIIWANVLQVSEVASTNGEITHQGDVVNVQHLVGGRVKKLFVKNGEAVKEGQTLISLDPVISQLELGSIQGKKALLSAQKTRLDALLNNKKPDFSQVEDSNIRTAQRLLYENTMKSFALDRKILLSQIDQVKTEIDLLKNDQAKLSKSVTLIKEELEIRSKLRAKGLNPRVTLLQLEKEYNEAEYSLRQIPKNIKKQKEKEQELTTTLASVSATYMENYSKELEQVNAEMGTVEKQISIFDSNIDALEIKAPVEGIIHDIQVKNPGQIAKPGDVLVTLIPTEKPLIAKVKISSRDIGHIQKGQQAVMRITTYDSRRYGVLKGVVSDISPSVIVPGDKTEAYYEGIIALDKEYIGKNADQMKLFSGMTLTADIKTGSKYFIEYLLKPIFIATQTSFHER